MTEPKKLKVIMVCAMGMSSSLLEAKILEAAKAAGVPMELKAVEASFMSRWDFNTDPLDLILVAPQVRFKKKSFTQAAAPFGIIVLDIDPVHFGMVEGEKVFQQIMAAIKERDAKKS